MGISTLAALNVIFGWQNEETALGATNTKSGYKGDKF